MYYLMKKILFFIFIILLSSFAYAKIENFNVDFRIIDNKVHVEESIVLDKEANFVLELPEDASLITLEIDSKLSNYTITNDEINVFAKDIKLSYITNKFLDKQSFLLDFKAIDDIDRFSIKLILPTYAVLTRPIDETTLASNAVFPKPTRLESDGQRLVIVWERSNLKKDDSFSALVMYKFEKSNTLFYIGILSILFIGVILFIVLRKPRAKIIVKKPKVIKKVVKADLERYLKEDEEQVVNILKQREGQCEQGTLRVVTGFSKAKLSGLLKELEERNIVYKEKRGKKNLVFLKK